MGFLYNFHLMAVPLFEEHTDEKMFVTMSTFLDAVVQQWKEIVVGVSTDGGRSMTGRVRGALKMLFRTQRLFAFGVRFINWIL
ncbi:hypothetical protein JG687_00018592 [Phytophthora cactorum]|uniref:Uncharacterized protein n=1 Tax=Phytophthora cactorum TaxID=29920 RepID=A0A8T1TQ83_9STRA|nr:hypothetical protein JG687_00018592 [Phytophthora cactorum]